MEADVPESNRISVARAEAPVPVTATPTPAIKNRALRTPGCEGERFVKEVAGATPAMPRVTRTRQRRKGKCGNCEVEMWPLLAYSAPWRDLGVLWVLMMARTRCRQVSGAGRGIGRECADEKVTKPRPGEEVRLSGHGGGAGYHPYGRVSGRRQHATGADGQPRRSSTARRAPSAHQGLVDLGLGAVSRAVSVTGELLSGRWPGACPVGLHHGHVSRRPVGQPGGALGIGGKPQLPRYARRLRRLRRSRPARRQFPARWRLRGSRPALAHRQHLAIDGPSQLARRVQIAEEKPQIPKDLHPVAVIQCSDSGEGFRRPQFREIPGAPYAINGAYSFAPIHKLRL